MAKIIVNAITHRAACTDGGTDQDLTEYNARAHGFFARLERLAAADGFAFEVDEQGQGGASYRVVDEADHDDLQAAHDFMQSSAADFWANT